MSRQVWLIGYRCCGKTTVGKVVAERLGLPLLDTDLLITQAAGKDVAGIVAEHGWEGFRRLERTVIQEIAARNESMVVSCGGGVVLHQDLMEEIAGKSLIVWLKASPEVICERMRRDPATAGQRPSLTGEEDLEAEVEAVLKERLPLYRRFSHMEFDTGAVAPEDVAEEIAAAFTRQ